jgi:Zn finger protein HypA/HybF involved in hydrogenase expression
VKRAIEDPDTSRQPLWAKCTECLHVWVLMYLPMPMALSAKLARAALCPKCGADAQKITPAKQANGALLEPDHCLPSKEQRS